VYPKERERQNKRKGGKERGREGERETACEKGRWRDRERKSERELLLTQQQSPPRFGRGPIYGSRRVFHACSLLP